MLLESEVLQMHWNQNSKYALAFGKEKYFIFPLLFMWFSKESKDLQEVPEDSRKRNELSES